MSDSQKMNEITNGFSNDLPEGWVWSNIGEIVEIKYGKGLIKENRKGGKFPVYGSNGIVGYHDQSLTHGQTIIIGRKGSVGEVHYSQIACCPIDTTYYIDNFVSVNSTYIFHLLRHSRLGELDKSTASLIVVRMDLLLDHVKKAQESLDKIPLVMKRFRQAALKKSFSGELTAEWRAQQQDLEPAADLLKRIHEERRHRYEEEIRWAKAEGLKLPKKQKETEPLHISDLPELPEKWCWASLPQMGELARGKSMHRPRDDERLFGGLYPFIQTGDVANSKGMIKSFSQTYSEFGLAQSRL